MHLRASWPLGLCSRNVLYKYPENALNSTYPSVNIIYSHQLMWGSAPPNLPAFSSLKTASVQLPSNLSHCFHRPIRQERFQSWSQNFPQTHFAPIMPVFSFAKKWPSLDQQSPNTCDPNSSHFPNLHKGSRCQFSTLTIPSITKFTNFRVVLATVTCAHDNSKVMWCE